MVKKWLIALIVIALIAGGGWWYLKTLKSKPIKVETVVVEKRDLNETVSGSGLIQPDRQVDLLPPVADEIEKVYVKEGDVVEEDDKVIKLKNAGKLKTSIDGKVIQLNAAIGQTAVPGKPLLVIADFDPAYFVANIDESDISKVSPGQKAEIVLDAYPGKTLLGEVSEIGFVSQQTTGAGTAFPVKIRLTDSKGVTLRLGMNGDVDITVGVKKAVVAVSLDAVTTRNGKDTVFLVENKKVKGRHVTLGLATNDYYEVTKGLNEGEKVVVKNLAKLKGGERVK
jgi:HlyD family secretion protein